MGRRRRRRYSKSSREVAVFILILVFPFWLIHKLLEVLAKNIGERLAKEKQAAKHLDDVSYSIELINSTLYPQTFFKRYDLAISSADSAKSLTHKKEIKNNAQVMLDNLTNNREQKIMEFVDRCYSQGRLYSVKNDLLSGDYDLSSSVLSHIDELIWKTENDFSDLPACGEYIYCSVSFGKDGKTYYYKTTDETLKCNDEVIVTVGNEGEKSVGKIEKIERFKAGQTPYPPSLTKEILGKCEF